MYFQKPNVSSNYYIVNDNDPRPRIAINYPEYAHDVAGKVYLLGRAKSVDGAVLSGLDSDSCSALQEPSGRRGTSLS